MTLDADGQHDPSEVSKLLLPVLAGEADLALGSRYLDFASSYRVPLGRRMGAWGFAKIVSLLAKKNITDPTTGFQCMNAKILNLYTSLADFPRKDARCGSDSIRASERMSRNRSARGDARR